MSFYTGQNNLDYLSAKEVEILQRRMDVRFNTEFFMRTNKMVDSLMTFKRDGYEDDLEFYNILRKVSDNLKGKHTKLLPKLKENARVYFEFRDKNDTLSQKDYTERFEAFYGNRKDVKMDEWELQRYILSSNKLGWINCDRFYNDPRRKVQVNIVSKSKDETFMLYLKEANAAVRSIQTGKYSRFKGMPYEALGTIIGIKYENGKVYVAKKNIKVSSKPIENFRYKEVALTDLKDEINSLAKF